MVSHLLGPALKQPAPITGTGVRVCRPWEAMMEVLPKSEIGPFSKEDGEVVNASIRLIS